MTIEISRDARGWRKLACAHRGCGKQTAFTPHDASRIHFLCRGWPHWFEFGEWVELTLSAFWINGPGIGRIVNRLGLVEVPEGQCPLGCEARKEWLNTLGGKLSTSTHWLGKWLSRLLVRRAK